MALRRRRSVRERIAERAGFRCEYGLCPQSHSPGAFAIEHIAPSAGGGPDAESNLALSCSGCNGFKATATTGIDPVTKEAAPLYHPRQDSWADHFLWSEDALRVEGRTPTGRASVARLRLNREGVVNLRELLKLKGLHPPPAR